MIGVVAEITIKEGANTAFEAIAGELAAAVNANEAGCRLYRLFKVRDSETRYIFMEQYEDEEAVAAHRASEHFRTLGRKMGEHLAAPPQITRMDSVEQG